MHKVVLQLIDLHSHLAILKARSVNHASILLNFFLLLGHRSLVPLLLLFQLDACLG